MTVKQCNLYDREWIVLQLFCWTALFNRSMNQEQKNSIDFALGVPGSYSYDEEQLRRYWERELRKPWSEISRIEILHAVLSEVTASVTRHDGRRHEGCAQVTINRSPKQKSSGTGSLVLTWHPEQDVCIAPAEEGRRGVRHHRARKALVKITLNFRENSMRIKIESKLPKQHPLHGHFPKKFPMKVSSAQEQRAA